MATVVMKNAKTVKKDEFYTQLADIENELKHYKEHFKNKTVFCNCDDPYESNFFKYFAMNFNHLGLKKLICTCYASSPIAWVQLSLFDNANVVVKTESGKQPYKIEITEVLDYNGDSAIDLSDVEYLLKNKENTLSILQDDGDFRSQECIELLKEADIIVTNPPFSLFREYVAQLINYNKKFLIIGNINAITYKEIFKLIKDGKIWGGYIFNKTLEFEIPNNYEGEIKHGKKYGKVPSITWFTNLETRKRQEPLPHYTSFMPEKYPKYVNYDAININKLTDIPFDYYEDMGVPITFLDKYNPSQFDIVGLGISSSGIEIGVKPYLPEHKKYRKEIQKKGAVDGDLYMLDENGHPLVPYARIIIRRKK